MDKNEETFNSEETKRIKERHNNRPPEKSEVYCAIQKLKFGKAAEIDGITMKVWKYGNAEFSN